MNKFSLALLSLLLSFPCVANIDGTFIQTWLYSYWDDERWDDEIASMKEIGIQEIIMADIASRNNGNEPWLCNYPSHLPNTNLSANETTKILKHAKKGGIKVSLPPASPAFSHPAARRLAPFSVSRVYVIILR